MFKFIFILLGFFILNTSMIYSKETMKDKVANFLFKPVRTYTNRNDPRHKNWKHNKKQKKSIIDLFYCKPTQTREQMRAESHFRQWRCESELTLYKKIKYLRIKLIKKGRPYRELLNLYKDMIKNSGKFNILTGIPNASARNRASEIYCYRIRMENISLLNWSKIS